MTPQPSSHRQRGLALVETLVVIGILGLLVSLLLPAVQATREASRRAHCANQMRQIMLALGAFETRFEVYPHHIGGPKGRLPRQYSAFTQLLPFLDATPIYNAINFDLPMDDPYFGHRAAAVGVPENATVMRLSIGGFLCPSDGDGGGPGWTGGTNYRFSLGLERDHRSGDPTGGVLSTRGFSTKAADIVDGLSNTVAMSERRRGHLDGPRNLQTAIIFARIDPRDRAEATYNQCARLPRTADHHGATGLSWFVGSLMHTCYNHLHSPNGTVPDCVTQRVSPPVGLVAARSNHVRGVNVGVANGSVRFVSDTIDRSLWKALGTRAEGEVIEPRW